MTLGTLMMSALILAGCGGGMGSFTPRAADHTTPASGARQLKTFRAGLAAGDFKPACAPAGARRARCSAVVLTASGAAAAAPLGPTAASALPAGYSPAELQAAYRLTAAAKTKGDDALIAIVDAFDDPHAERDLAVYRARYGLPPCTTANRCFQKVNQAGRSLPMPAVPTGLAIGWTVETALDLDMVSANCPRCRILLVEANDDFLNNLGTAVNTAANMGAVAISNSYVAQESPTDPLAIAAGGVLPYYVHPNVAVVAGAGDFNFAFSGPVLGPLIPAAFPTVVTVGGTQLVRDADSPRGWSESAWDGTGSGCSAFEAMPPWQTSTPNCTGSLTDSAGTTTTFPSRIYGDVAYVASPYTGVAVYESDGQLGTTNWGVFGGTSVGAPAIAAIYGLSGYGQSERSAEDENAGEFPFPAAKLYRARHALFDITTGTNGLCSPTFLCTAGPGYDGPTGNGTPNGIGAF
jgi:hypothetical protein